MRLYTFGYLGGDWGRLDAVLSAPRSILIDVRFSPHSRVSGFNKPDFQKLFGEQYLHLKALGNTNYKGGPIRLENESAGVAQVCHYLRQGYQVVLMCACRDAHACHRTVAAQKVAEAMGGEVEIVNLEKGQDDPQQLLWG